MGDKKRTSRRLMVIGITTSVTLIALAVWLLSRPSTTPADTPQRIYRIGYQEISLYQHLFTAAEKNFFEDEGVRVELVSFTSANQMAQALIAGQIQGTGLTNLQVALSVQAADTGLFKFVNMLVWRDRSYPDYILVRTGAGVDSLTQLRGKTLGLHPGSAVRAFATAVLERDGLDPETVNMVELQPDVMQSSVAAGRVDALYCMDPVATSLLASGQAKVLVANPMSRIFQAPVPISGAVLSRTLLNGQPEDARRIILALDRAIEYVRDSTHRREVAGYIAKYTPVDSALALRMNPSDYWTSQEIDAGRIQALANRFQELGIVDTAVDVQSFLLASTHAVATPGARQ